MDFYALVCRTEMMEWLSSRQRCAKMDAMAPENPKGISVILP